MLSWDVPYQGVSLNSFSSCDSPWWDVVASSKHEIFQQELNTQSKMEKMIFLIVARETCVSPARPDKRSIFWAEWTGQKRLGLDKVEGAGQPALGSPHRNLKLKSLARFLQAKKEDEGGLFVRCSSLMDCLLWLSRNWDSGLFLPASLCFLSWDVSTR